MNTKTDRPLNNFGFDMFHSVDKQPQQQPGFTPGTPDWYQYEKMVKLEAENMNNQNNQNHHNQMLVARTVDVAMDGNEDIDVNMGPCPDSAFVAAPDFSAEALEDFNDLDISNLSTADYSVSSFSPKSETSTSMSTVSGGSVGRTTGSPEGISGGSAAGGYGKNKGRKMTTATTTSNNTDNPNDLEEQEKKKAQNRAAQRAFRERREQRVKELEARLAEATATIDALTKQLEENKSETTVLRVENNCLKEQLKNAHVLAASSADTPTSVSGATCPMDSDASQPKTTRRSSKDGAPSPSQQAKVGFPSNLFYETLLSSHYEEESEIPEEEPSFRVYESGEDGDTFLGAGAIWQLINDDPSVPEDLDLARVVEFLKDKAMCDGKGPVYRLSVIKKALEFAAES